MANSLADLHAEIDFLQQYGLTPAWTDKMVHRVPEFPVIEREPYIVGRAKGLRVLDIGCAGSDLHAHIQASASWVIGLDHEPCGHPGDIWLDLDDYQAMQAWEPPQVDLIVMAEVIEHVCNPGFVLKTLKAKLPQVPVLITTPNAMASASQVWMRRGIECVNPDHNAWYSWHTLKVLLEKCGFTPEAWAWYNGEPKFSEGIICLAR